jgi:hypothetical protein
VARTLALVIGAVLLAGCSGSGSANSTSPTPRSTPTPPVGASPASGGPFAVLVQRAGAGEPYVLQLVRADGRALPAVHARARSLKTFHPSPTACPSAGCPTSATANYQLPETSVSATHVYFLDGEADLKSMSPSGTTALIRHLDVDATSNLAFAVSPDDRRIAIAVISYPVESSGPAFSLRLYAEDLVGGGNRSEVFTSTSVVEWPIGWRGGDVVLAVGEAGVYTGFNPYGAVEYHLADPATWSRRAGLACSFGPLVAAGSACWKPPMLGSADWSGAMIDYRLEPAGAVARLQPTYLALSPDGRQVAGAVRTGSVGIYDTELFADGSESLLVPGAAPLGWLDGSHLLVIAAGGAAIAAVPGGGLVPVTGLTPLPTQGLPSLLGVLPASLG